MVKLELGLPWKPVLAWPWGVEYDIDVETFLITNHKETWDIEPIEVSLVSSWLEKLLHRKPTNLTRALCKFQGVKQIFRKPTTQVND